MDAVAEAIPDKNERQQRKKTHLTRVELQKSCGEDTEDDDTVESQAALFDDLVDCNINIGRAKAQKKSVNIAVLLWLGTGSFVPLITRTGSTSANHVGVQVVARLYVAIMEIQLADRPKKLAPLNFLHHPPIIF